MLKGSWRTTTVGILAAVATLAMAIRSAIEGQPVDWPHVIEGALIAVGLLSARDNKTTSEDAGAKPTVQTLGKAWPR